MKSCKFSLSMFLTISMFCSLVAAQQGASTQSSSPVPRLVNFTGRAADAQGKPIAGIAGVTFAIYKDQYEGAPLWLETQNIQADAKGNYTAQLGATKPAGLPLDLFSSGDARWLGVTVNGGQEQPRVLLLSVPYALKAADAETIGGLPPSAFVLAASLASSATAAASSPSSASAASAPPTNPPVTGVGTAPFIPLWDTSTDIVNSVLFQSGTGSTAKVGINTTTPGATLDVKGTANVQGLLTLPATGMATSTGGKPSQAQNLVASSFNSSTAAGVNQTFQWKAEAVSDNTSTPSGTLNLLFGSGTSSPTETGLKLSNKGLFTFATGQRFPGAGTVASVGLSAPSSDFTVTGSPVTNSGTLNLNWNVVPTPFNTANAIVKRDVAGSFNAGAILASLGLTGLSAGTAGVTGTNSSSGYGVYGSSVGGLGVYGTSSGGPAIWGESTGTSGGADGVHGVAHGPASGVAGVNDSTSGVGVWGQGPGLAMYANGNVGQARTSGGWVKAMVYVNAAQAPYTIIRCYNSTLAGAVATIPPCGFNLTEVSPGVFDVTFGFEIDDRFWSATSGLKNVISTNSVAVILNADNIGSQDIYVYVQDISGNPSNAYFNLIVY